MFDWITSDYHNIVIHVCLINDMTASVSPQQESQYNHWFYWLMEFMYTQLCVQN